MCRGGRGGEGVVLACAVLRVVLSARPIPSTSLDSCQYNCASEFISMSKDGNVRCLQRPASVLIAGFNGTCWNMLFYVDCYPGCGHVFLLTVYVRVKVFS